MPGDRVGAMESTSIRAAAALDDELRWRIHAFIRKRRHSVTREEVATAVGISRRLAAFHLDKLLERGILQADFARPTGRGGPGAGRPAKRYRPSGEQIRVSIPERRYDLAGALFMEAIRTQAPGERSGDAALRVARDRGFDVGSRARKEFGLRKPGSEQALRAAEHALEPYGFEPYRPSRHEVALANCPFHALAQEAPELVCQVNRSFIEGVVRGLGNETVQAVLERLPADCCVTIRAPRIRRIKL
jgi:predicted ArsR family transcriptional regulator